MTVEAGLGTTLDQGWAAPTMDCVVLELVRTAEKDRAENGRARIENQYVQATA